MKSHKRRDMKTNKESLLYGVIGLLLGILIAGGSAITAVNSNNRSMMQMMGMNTSLMKTDSSDHMGMSMNDMSDELENRTGDEFDQYFISMMIAHHQGAIDMAKLAESRAKHSEIKQLSTDIISTQTKEITNMKAWQSAWGYDTNGINTMMMH